MPTRVFSANSYSYCVIDNNAAGNYGMDSLNPASATAIAGANGYDICTVPTVVAGAISQMKNPTGQNGSLPDFLNAPTTVLNSPLSATIRFKNPA